jgi:hypothetical protein
MKAELTLKELIFKFFGFGYIVNYGSKEIHRLENKHPNCRTEMIANGQFVTKKRAYKLIADNGFNGCRFCWKEKDKG